jgi:threonine/homoserine/homoserine lactone efflux protein
MDDSWVTLLLLGLTAAFMPLVFSLEIYVLGADDGVKKASSLLGGITLFRLLITLLVVLLFAGVMASLSQGLSDIGQVLGSLISQINKDITSGHHLIIDLLLVAAGLSLFVQAIRHLRRGSNVTEASGTDSSKAMEVGVGGMIGMGIMMTATNVQQWLLISAGVNQILRASLYPWIGLLAYLFFLLLATSLILLPLAIFLIRPQKAGARLAKVDGWINGSMRYVVAGILFLIGFYLIWKGGEGVVRFLSG